MGVCGSDEKCKRLVEELGFDIALNRHDAGFRDALKAATPQRIDIYFDNTGGEILQSCLFRMAQFGRIICCGNVSGYDVSKPGGGPRGVPGLLVNNQVKMEGFVVYNYEDKFEGAREEMSAWVAEGSLKPWASVYEGFEAAPGAFVDLLAGETSGTTIVRW